MAVAAPQPEVIYEGPGDDAEAWGFTQANFTLRVPGRTAREVAVMLNHPAAAHLASELGRDSDRDFRRAAARAAGELWLPELAKRGTQLDPLVTVSKAVLDANPDLVKKLLKALKA